jgi:S1-C subfamily serine protease
VGIGSLQLPHRTSTGHVLPLNMSVPIDLLKPILDDLLTKGRVDAPARPWLGVFSTEVEADEVVVAGLAGDGPAKRAGLREGDRIVAVAGQPASSLADLYRAIWSLGSAGVDVLLTLEREGDRFDVTVRSGDRSAFLKRGRRLH